MVTRDEGYRRSRGKEKGGLEVAQDFLRAVFDLTPDVIHCPHKNRTQGDLQVLLQTVEVKRQPIDPDKYDKNFVEVFEDTTARRKPHHHDGLARTAAYLGLTIEQLARSQYWDHRGEGKPERRTVGPLSHASASLASIAGSAFTIYVNPSEGMTWVYVYSRRYLLHELKQLVKRGQLRRGMGKSNEDTFACLVPISPARWKRHDGSWRFHGRPCDEGTITRKIKAALVSDPGAPRGAPR